MNEPSNGTRVEWAKLALHAHKEAKGESGSLSEDDAIDLIADLMHYVRSHKGDVEQIVRMATTHFDAEKLRRYTR